ncbi:contractile injection system tape measure protein [Winogradskyella sp. 3972H.M.0a.05]|uniref:contractile injection system tape measure protein n=1 Tax=Winogradskyella sp. 3972H.M.0a.05 TaxID=2950277 RepID=UPI003397EFDF
MADTNNSKYHIENAGLVLCHPFITTLFKRLEYLNSDNQFKDEDSKTRAILLLHYIATGKLSYVEEQSLDLPKLICGLQMDSTIKQNVSLSDKERNEAQELIKAIISHWQSLKNTSPEGLRETFLNRDGLLEIDDETYKIMVESRAMDILLSTLPWSISMIKLPWLKRLIMVSWN